MLHCKTNKQKKAQHIVKPVPSYQIHVTTLAERSAMHFNGPYVLLGQPDHDSNGKLACISAESMLFWPLCSLGEYKQEIALFFLFKVGVQIRRLRHLQLCAVCRDSLLGIYTGYKVVFSFLSYSTLKKKKSFLDQGQLSCDGSQ